MKNNLHFKVAVYEWRFLFTLQLARPLKFHIVLPFGVVIVGFTSFTAMGGLGALEARGSLLVIVTGTEPKFT